MHVLKAASRGYGPEKRVILLHGPVGSSKIDDRAALEAGSRATRAATTARSTPFDWVNLQGTGLAGTDTDRFPSPMNEEPLRLVGAEWRTRAIDELGLSNEKFKVKVEGISIRRAASS